MSVFGKFNLVSQDNIGAFMKAMEAPAEFAAKAEQETTDTFELKDNGDGTWTHSNARRSVNFKFGESWEGEWGPHKATNVIRRVSDTKFERDIKVGNKEIKCVWEFSGDELKATQSVGGVTTTRTFKRA